MPYPLNGTGKLDIYTQIKHVKCADRFHINLVYLLYNKLTCVHRVLAMTRMSKKTGTKKRKEREEEKENFLNHLLKKRKIKIRKKTKRRSNYTPVLKHGDD